MEEDSHSRLTEKNWRAICERLKMGACPHLESIHIPGNHIGYQGVEALMEVYQDGYLKACTELDLSGNGIGTKGIMTLSHLFDLPNICTGLRRLKLANNQIRPKGWTSFIDHFTAFSHHHLIELDLSSRIE